MSQKMNVSAFVEALAIDVAKGYGIIPLTGAGISVPSGVPDGKTLSKYLNMCLNNNTNIKTGHWPNIDESQFKQSKNDERDYMIVLLEIASRQQLTSQEVFDSFFAFLLRGRKPTQVHRMLVQLASLLGTNVMLTLNFDELQEMAMREARMPFQVFEVPSGGTLPNYYTVSEMPTLVKLHGGKISIVAGNDVHKLPTITDLDNLVSYITDAGSQCNNHILVLGFAGKDTRVIAFLKHVLDKHADAKLYWVCFSGYDAKNFKDAFVEFGERAIYTTQYEPGLLLLHLYQRICLCLPHQSVDFPSSAKLPLPPYPTGQDIIQKVDGKKGELETTVKNHSLVLYFPSNVKFHGVVSVASCLFHEIYAENICIWLDLHEAIPEYELFYEIYALACARQRKTVEVRSMTNGANMCEVKNALRDSLTTFSTKRTIVFLNLRPLQRKVDANIIVGYLRRFVAKNTDKFCLLVMLCTEAHNKRSGAAVTIQLTEDVCPFNEPQVKDNDIYFYHGLLLFRHSIHFAALTSRAFFQASTKGGSLRDHDRAKHAFGLVDTLVGTNRLRVKRGGFVWVQFALKECLTVVVENSSVSSEYIERSVRLMRAIADWYHKLFYASSDCDAALEGLHFRIEVLKNLQSWTDSNPKLERNTVLAYVFSTCSQACYILRYARGALMTHENRFGIYRRLEQALSSLASLDGNDAWKSSASLKELNVTILSLMTELARQSGDTIAARKHIKCIGRLLSITARGPAQRVWNLKYETGIIEISLSNFEGAKSKLKTNLKGLSRGCNASCGTYETGLEHLLTKKAWLPLMCENSCEPCLPQANLRLALSITRRYLQVISEELRLIEGLVQLGENKVKLQAGILFSNAERTYAKARELRRYIKTTGGSGFLLREASQIRTFHAQILALSGHFYEAQRRINEAASNLRYCSRYADRGWWAEYELGRCDVILNRLEMSLEPNEKLFSAEKYLNTGDLSVVYRAGIRLLNAAVNTLLQAKDLLAYRGDSPYWSTKYCESCLRAIRCSQILQTKNPSDNANLPTCATRLTESVVGILKRGLAFTAGDAYRQARLLLLAHTICVNPNCDERDRLIAIIRDYRNLSAQNPVDERVKKYVEHVRVRLNRV